MTFVPNTRPFDPEMNSPVHVSHFGAMKTSATQPVLRGNFAGNSVDTNVWTTTTANGGTITVDRGVASLTTSTASNGSVKITSVDAGSFEAGQVTVFQSGVFAGSGVADNIRRWGLLSSDEQDGLYFEWNGTDFRVVAKAGGTVTAVSQASFNGSTTWSPSAANNTFRIHYSAGRAYFQRASAGQIVTLHTMVDSDYPLVENLNLGIFYENINSGNTTDVEMRVRGASSSIFGELPTIRPKNIEDDITSNTVLKPTAAVLVGEKPNGVFAAKLSTGTAALSTTPLADGETWDSGIIDATGYAAITYIVYADQPFEFAGATFDDALGTTTLEDFDVTVPLNIEGNTIARDVTVIVPRTPFADLRITNNSGSPMTVFYAEIRLNAEPPSPSQLALSTPLRDGTAVGITKAVIAGKDPDNVYQNVAITDTAALLTGDFLQEVVRGNINGHSVISKFGRNSAITTSSDPEDAWEGGGDYSGQPLHSDSAETVEVFSSDSNDTSAGTGARTIYLSGLDENWEEQNETVTMSGTTPVVTSGQWRRLNRAYVVTAGSGGGNAGVITARHTTTTANVFMGIPIGQNQTTIGAYTIPAGKTGYLTSIYASMARSNGSNGSAQISVRVREEGGVYRAARYFTVTNALVYNPPMKIPFVLTEKTDIKVRIESVSDNTTQFTCEFDIQLIDD